MWFITMSTMQAAIASTTFEEFSNGIYDSIGEGVELNDQIIKFFANRLEKTISKNIANSLSTAY